MTMQQFELILISSTERKQEHHGKDTHTHREREREKLQTIAAAKRRHRNMREKQKFRQRWCSHAGARAQTLCPTSSAKQERLMSSFAFRAGEQVWLFRSVAVH